MFTAFLEALFSQFESTYFATACGVEAETPDIVTIMSPAEGERGAVEFHRKKQVRSLKGGVRPLGFRVVFPLCFFLFFPFFLFFSFLSVFFLFSFFSLFFCFFSLLFSRVLKI